MKIYFLVLSLCFSISSLAKVYSHSYLKVYDKNQSLDVNSSFPFHTGNQDKVIQSIRIGIYMIDEPGDRNLLVTINNISYTIEVPVYEMGDHEYKEFFLNIEAIKQKDIESFKIQFPQKSSVTHLSLYFQKDYQGINHQTQFKRAQKLALFNLYEQGSNEKKNKLVRSRGIRDLGFFPGYDSLETIREIVDYDPPYNDYANDYIGRDVFLEIIKMISKNDGEIKLAKTLETIFEDSKDRFLENHILNSIFDMETSAGLFFAIRFHIYSPLTERRVNGDRILENIYKKPDADKFMKLYQSRIIEEIFKYNDSYDPEFAQERACNTFKNIPQHGLFELLFNIVKSDQSFLDYSCSSALESIFDKLDITEEITSEYHKVVKDIILEPYYKPSGYIFHNGYSHTGYTRNLAIYTLGELGDKATLKEALKNPKLGKYDIELIKRFL